MKVSIQKNLFDFWYEFSFYNCVKNVFKKNKSEIYLNTQPQITKIKIILVWREWNFHGWFRVVILPSVLMIQRFIPSYHLFANIHRHLNLNYHQIIAWFRSEIHLYVKTKPTKYSEIYFCNLPQKKNSTYINWGENFKHGFFLSTYIKIQINFNITNLNHNWSR